MKKRDKKLLFIGGEAFEFYFEKISKDHALIKATESFHVLMNWCMKQFGKTEKLQNTNLKAIVYWLKL